MASSIQIKLPSRGDGPVGADTLSLPPGIELATSWDPKQRCYLATVHGPPEAVAAVGLRLAEDAISQAIRALHRHSFERINELARHIGRDDLDLTEEQAVQRVAQSLLSGGGLPEPPTPEES